MWYGAGWGQGFVEFPCIICLVGELEMCYIKATAVL